MADASSSKSAYMYADNVSSKSAYLEGSKNQLHNKPAYLLGGIAASDNQSAYLEGVIAASDSQSAFLAGTEDITSSRSAYLAGQVASSKPAYLEGIMTSYNYIILTNSDDSVTKQFRVLARGYNDGGLEKAQTVRRTLGGALDASMGSIFKIWNPTIRVRHTESETDYGDREDLEYFYGLNNPNGVPNNVITFTDHHGVDYEVLITGSFENSLLGTQIEGENAWFIVQLRMERIINE